MASEGAPGPIDPRDLADGTPADPASLRRQVADCRRELRKAARGTDRVLTAVANARLGMALMRLASLTGRDIGLTRRAADRLRAAMAPEDATAEYWRAAAHGFRHVLLELGKFDRDDGMMEESLRIGRFLLRTSAPEATYERSYLHRDVGATLAVLGARGGNVRLLREAARSYGRAVHEQGSDRDAEGWAWTRLAHGDALAIFGEAAVDASSLEAALEPYAEAIAWCSERGLRSDAALIENNLAAALTALGEITQDEQWFEEAIAACRRSWAFRRRHGTRDERGMTKHNWAIALLGLGDVTSSGSLLTESVKVARHALSLRTQDRSPDDWAMTQSNLGVTLMRLGDLRAEPRFLELAAMALRSALTVRTKRRSPLDWSTTQNNLGVALSARAELTGDRSALQAAVEAFMKAASVLDPERQSAAWAKVMANAGGAFVRLGRLTGRPSHFERSVEILEACLRVIDRRKHRLEWAKAKNSLGQALEGLGDARGDPAVTEAAITAFGKALRVYRNGSPPWAMVCSNLGDAHRRLGELSGNDDDYRRAAAWCDRALGVYGRKSAPAEWARAQTNRSNALVKLGEATGDGGALRSAIAGYEAALSVRRQHRSPTLWAMTNANLGAALVVLGEITGSAACFRRALKPLRAAAERFIKQGSRALRAGVENNIATSLDRLSEVRPDPGTLSMASDGYRLAIELLRGLGLEDQRQGIANRLADMLVRLGRHGEAIELIEAALRRSNAAMRDAARGHGGRERTIEQIGGLYALLSLCRLRGLRRQPRRAFEAAEAGRALLLARVFEEDGAGASTGGRGEGVRLGIREMRKAIPPGGALVMPVLTRDAAFAFVLTERSSEPLVLEDAFGSFGEREANEMVFGEQGWVPSYALTVRSSHWARTARTGQRTSRAYRLWNHRLRNVQAWLWKRLLGPLDGCLRSIGLPPKAEVVLIAPGLLGALPLHAAGPDAHGSHFCDYWTVSLSPSIRCRLECVARAADRCRLPIRMLVAANPTGDPRLSGATLEGRALEARLGDATEVLERGAATVDKVSEGLSKATHFHASTHGHHDALLPRRSSLLLADGKLDTAGLEGARLATMRLVFLSACESGLSGAYRLRDEFIGLPAAFLQAGTAGVIGSLWPVFDDAALLLTVKFYELYFDRQRPITPVEALATARSWLRWLTYGEARGLLDRWSESGRSAMAGHSRFVRASHEGRTWRSGDDSSLPYAEPHEWAAFTLSGV